MGISPMSPALLSVEVKSFLGLRGPDRSTLSGYQGSARSLTCLAGLGWILRAVGEGSEAHRMLG